MADSDPEYPVRLWGSQKVRLYADANSDLIISVFRDKSILKARAMVEVSGLLVDMGNGIPSPTGLRFP